MPLHSIYDNDMHFTIDTTTRTITNASEKNRLMQYDHNSERFTFEVPRYVEGHDLSLSTKVEIHYANISADGKSQNADVYTVDDLGTSPNDINMVILSWLISGNATQYAGSLNFLIRFVCMTGDTIDYAWHTDICSDIRVGEGMNNGDSVIAEYCDVLETWKREVLDSFGFEFDDVPTEGSENLVKSGGVYSWTIPLMHSIASEYAQGVAETADSQPTEGSTNLVQSGGVWEHITGAYGFAVETVNSLRLTFDTATNTLRLYKENEEESPIAEIEIPLDGKLDKVTSSTGTQRVYFVSESGVQKTQPMVYTKASDWSVAQRGDGGVLFVGTPTKDGHATTKKYVDDAIAALRAELTS